MKEKVEKWYRSIPEHEKDLYILELDGKYYTPNDIYREVMNDTELGKRLQEELERLSLGNTFTYEDMRKLMKIAEMNVYKIVEMLPKDFSIASYGGVIVKREAIPKVLGKEAMQYELERIIENIRRFRHG